MEKDKTVVELLHLLEQTTIAINTSRTNSGVGRTQCFGIINNRRGLNPAKNNFRFPYLFKFN